MLIKDHFILYFIILLLSLLSCQKSLYDMNRYIKSVSSSSKTLKSAEILYNYKPENLIDGNMKTCWQESVKGPGIGEWIEFTFNQPINIDMIQIANGFQDADKKYGDLYYLNNRVKKARLCSNMLECIDLKFDDKKGWSKFNLSFKRVKSIKILITEAYKGKRWDDTAVSEVIFFSSSLP